MASLKGPAKKRLAALALAAGAIAAVAGCTSPFSQLGATPAKQPAKQQKAATDATVKPQTTACADQQAWTVSGGASMKALYADTGALAADASAGNAPGVEKAGHKLATDALVAATLPLPPVDPASWKAMTAAYAAAGSAIAGGNASGAIPQLEAGNSAIGAFAKAVAKCPAAKSL
jgi:hypothetical protein